MAVRKRANETDENNNFFVGIENPMEMRRQVLESSKKLVEVLKKFESFREKREQKLLLMEKLKRTLSEINRMNAKLRAAMPKTNLRVPHQLLGIPERPKAGPSKAAEKEELPAGEMERLEMELQDIESKLGKLQK